MSSPAVEAYLKRKAELARPTGPERVRCLHCRKPSVSCYCARLSPIASRPRIAILMHPLEVHHPVGTGRMAHQCLSNSHLFEGVDFTNHAALNALLDDPRLAPFVLYPGPTSVDLSKQDESARRTLVPEGREPLVLVLDGTWNLAKKILTRTPRLQTLPRVCFTPTRPSGFLVRKQPKALCFSTIEAIHETITLMNPDSALREHDRLLEVFDAMVAQQLSFRQSQQGATRHSKGYWERKARRARWRALKRELALRAASPV